MNDSFVFYKSFYEAALELDASDRLEFFDALTQYAITGKEPDIESPVARAIFKMARPQIDANEKRREDGKKGAEYGILGGGPKKEKREGVSDKNPSGVIAKTPNVNVNANANANVKDITRTRARARKNTFTEFSDQHSYDFDKMTFLAKPIGGQL